MKRRIMLWFLAVGLVIPIAWMSLYHLVPEFADCRYKTPSWAHTVLLTVWPSAILLVGDPLDENVSLWVLSAVTNACLYALFGLVVGIAFTKK